MSSIDIDTSELRKFAIDLGKIPDEVAGEIRPIVARGALNIKNQMIDEARGSDYFEPLADAMSYDTTVDADGVTGLIGPDRDRSGGAGLLGAYFGWSKGGATVPDPIGALEAEVPNVERFIGDAIDKAFGR